MITAQYLITRLQTDFDCRLTTEQILNILNALEKRLAFDIVRKTQTRIYDVEPDKRIYEIDVDQNRVVRVFVNDKEIQKRHSYISDGYICEHGCIEFSQPFESGKIYIECLVIPEDIDEVDMGNRPLFLDDGYDEIYLYHILSREALMSGNIEMLNNYSLLYAQALNSLKSEIANSPKGEAPKEENSATSYKNVW
ncbi:MAG: hypothetical protein IJY33_03680 [Oscillospiraceae bacterium]|nr:hypothetical protein [Oscillospiraceae bacterium]